jgi:outer membrane biosynthesis protein TonB
LPDKLQTLGEPEPGDGGPRDAPSSDAADESDARKKNDATLALSEQDLQAMRVPTATPPAVPTPPPAPAPKVSRHDASMWGGTVLVADEFEPLVVPKTPLGRWFLLAFFTLGLAAAALYFLWWQPSHDVAASEEPTDTSPIAAAAPAAPQPAAAPSPAPTPAAAGTAPATDTAAAAAEPAAVSAENPTAAPPPVKKTSSSKKKTSKKKTSKKKTSSKSKRKKTSKSKATKSRRGG